MNKPKNRTEMIELMRDTIANTGADLGEVDDEALALLASGRLDLLPPDQRQTILRQVAARPDLGNLLQELSALNWAQDVPENKIHPFLRLTQGAWAAAACAVLAMFLWRIVDSPIPPKPRGLDLPPRPLLYPRDWALVLCISALLLITALWAFLKTRRNKPQ